MELNLERTMAISERQMNQIGAGSRRYFLGCAVGGKMPFSRKYIAAAP